MTQIEKQETEELSATSSTTNFHSEHASSEDVEVSKLNENEIQIQMKKEKTKISSKSSNLLKFDSSSETLANLKWMQQRLQNDKTEASIPNISIVNAFHL